MTISLFKSFIAGALAAMPLSMSALEAGSEVSLADNLHARIISINGTNAKVEVFANPDSRPSGALEIKNSYSTPDGTVFTVTRIADNAFAYSDITSVTTGAELEKIGAKAFVGCTKLREFNQAGEGTILSIGDEAFRFNYALTEVEFPKCSSIGQFAFASSALQRASFPAVEHIEAGAFQQCKSLTTFEGGEYLLTIGNIAFSHCSLLKGLTLGNSLTSIGAMAISFTESLEDIVLPASLLNIGNSVFRGSGVKRVFILAGNFMDFCDSSELFVSDTLSEVYSLTPLVGEIKYYLSVGSADHAATTLAKASVRPMMDVVAVSAIGNAYDFTITPCIGGVADLKAYDVMTDTVINPHEGLYHIDSDAVRLTYTIDAINHLDYIQEIDNIITGMTLPGADITATHADGIYTLSGLRIDTPEENLPAGLYIILQNGRSSLRIIR